MIDSHALRLEVAKRRQLLINSEFGLIPSSIPYLEGLLPETSSLDEKHLIFALILGECTRIDNWKADLHYQRLQIASLPLQPIFLTSLASSLAKDPASHVEAFARCAEAVWLAIQENRQVRYCLTCQARLSLALDDYETLASALKGLIADAHCQRSDDTQYAFDFVNQIDARRIDSSLLAQYMALA